MKLANWLANNILSQDKDTVEMFIETGRVSKAIYEANVNSTTGGEVDDGPTTWFTNNASY